jgi:hypothetical protein
MDRTFWSTIVASVVSSFLAGHAVNLSRGVVGYLNDRRWNEMAIKNTALAAQCIRDLREAEKPSSGAAAQALEPYSVVLNERLKYALLQLQRVQERRAAQARKQFEEPAGIRRWLLLYRPYGYAARILHSSFYGILCVNATVIVLAIHAERRYALAAAIFVPLCFGGALWARSLALRCKRLMVLGKGQPNPNRDLNWAGKLFLMFRLPGRADALERFFSYLCWAGVFYGVYVLIRDPKFYDFGVQIGSALRGSARFSAIRAIIDDENFSDILAEVFGVMFFTLLGWMLSCDILLRRALARLNTLKHQGTELASNSSDTPLTAVRAASAGGSSTI